MTVSALTERSNLHELFCLGALELDQRRQTVVAVAVTALKDGVRRAQLILTDWACHGHSRLQAGLQVLQVHKTSRSRGQLRLVLSADRQELESSRR